jgi:hypothetical protein
MGGIMTATIPKIYVFSSVPDQGKTKLVLELYNHFSSKGYRVACLQANKGQKDFKVYIKKDIYHYSIPLEAAKSRAELEKWIPAGFDIYLMEITLSNSPVDIAYLSLFDNINEVISSEYLDSWEDYVLKYFEDNWIHESSNGECKSSDFWDYIHDRNVQKVIIGTMGESICPFMDSGGYIHNVNSLVYEEIDPKYTFPVSNKRLITVGAFPGEYWDIYSHMRWYSSKYAKFMERFRNESYDIAVIGDSAQEKLKLQSKPKNHPVICYQPGVYDNIERKEPDMKVNTDFKTFIKNLNNILQGNEISDEDNVLSRYNNSFRTFKPVPERESVWREGNIVFCNGWIHPQYLISKGFLEVE